MKTPETILSTICVMTAATAGLALATGLPFVFALCLAGSAISVGFAVTVVIGAVIHPARQPLSLMSQRQAIRPPAKRWIRAVA